MIELVRANALHIPLPDESVQCVVSSPPYWGLRDYGIEPLVWGGDPECEHQWGREQIGMDGVKTRWTHNPDSSRDQIPGRIVASTCECGAWRGSLGLEPTPDLYVEHMVAVFREVRRVLRKDGTCWVNMGDCYMAAQGGRQSAAGMMPITTKRTQNEPRNRPGLNHMSSWAGRDVTAKVLTSRSVGLKPKDLVGMPWRLAFALQADGWWLRSDIVWSKPNPMPESVTDRPTKSHEYVFLLAKSADYYWDQEAVREIGLGRLDRSPGPNGRIGGAPGTWDSRPLSEPNGRNIRSVWTIATEPFPGAHFATFPQKLVEPCVLAGTSEVGACAECGAPWERAVEKDGERQCHSGSSKPSALMLDRKGERSLETSIFKDGLVNSYRTTGWQPACAHLDAPTEPCMVLDPFAGSGTVGLVAGRLGRSFVGLDLNRKYLAMARERTRGVRVQVPMALDVRGDGKLEQLTLAEEP